MLSNLYLNEVDKTLERAREITRNGKYTYIEYARFADDLVILIDAYKRHDWLIRAMDKRLREEFGKLQVEIVMKRVAQWTLSAVSASGYRVRRDGPKVAPAG
ncbi:hypothetical protein IVB18_41590 [Bradyrhizobium sp. 186]|uniref:hypothetical protein n=1 Tax=Bradyrhizobium sp. 186 TaxID=2782654 RepID=UPI0020008BCF|nr:hypothetical protein [Bradyrhizobium sp. 186]UPK34504.1 hypothetical protein IVB18_41590 [Bradyrhizobium sp. 186]